MQGGKHRSEADVADTAKDDIKSHVDLSVLPAELLRGNINAAAGGDDDADSLVNDVDALEDIDRVIMIGDGDPEDVDAVDKAVYDAVAALDADDDLAAGGSEGVVADGFGGVGVFGGGVFVGGEGAAGLAEGGEGAEGA